MASELGNLREISELQRQMAQIRQELHLDVQGAVRSAQSLTDWRSFIAAHPWLSLGIAATTGFLLVPRRRETERIVTVAAPLSPASTGATPPSGRARSHWSAFQTAYDLIAPVAFRAAQSYALAHLERWLAAHPLVMPHQAAGAGGAEGSTDSERPAGPRQQGVRAFGA
jgi:hypothetical protein